ncbi:recombinase family protein [Rugosimonospora africana]|uniref:recombinase family protein n=1 Tax=Rugosimonospora africana TaxID=556532 RepID=UPI001945590B
MLEEELPQVPDRKDKASGLREDRPGLARLLKAGVAGEFTMVRVTGQDRLARFCTQWLPALLARDGSVWRCCIRRSVRSLTRRSRVRRRPHRTRSASRRWRR